MIEMSDYDMGRLDALAGLEPIPDFQGTEEDVEYMQGYNEVKQQTQK